jgi:transposase-like protein
MENQVRVRRRFTMTEKADLVAAYLRSGLSQEQFALQEGIAPSNIQRWIQQGRAAPERKCRRRLVEVPNLLAAPPANALYRLRWSQGMVLELNRGFEPEAVRVLVQLLQSL